MIYSSDITDTEWSHIEYCFPKPSRIGRPREHTFRQLLNAIFYVAKTGCQWRYLPKDLPPWQTVYTYFRCWKNNGLFEKIHTHLREFVRLAEGRNREPSAGIIDSQSVKSTECSQERGFDAGKKVNGRKRHIIVDTIGMILTVVVLSANIQDRDGAKTLLDAHFSSSMGKKVKHIWADGEYAGSLLDWAKSIWGCVIEIVKRNELHKFVVLPRRWVVERTFGWLGRYRRLNRDYERQSKTGETMVYLAMIRLMLARLNKL